MPELVLYRPLPPQRWGLLPTSQFWVRAWLTPIAIVYWAGYVVFFTLAEYLQLNWWQTALGVCVFHEIWGGLVERHYRRTLARATPLQASEAASGPAVTERSLPSRPREISLEDWESFASRIFGRWSGAAQKLIVVALCLLFFYPGWQSKLLAVAIMGGSTWIARSCIRRRRPALDRPSAPTALRDTECSAAPREPENMSSGTAHAR